jgi:hypothetical protein
MPAISKKWAAMNDGKRKKYEDLAVEEKAKFEEHLALVKKYLISKPAKEKATAYQIFLDDAARTAIENLDDLKAARARAKDEWNNLSNTEKGKWEEKKEANKELYERLRETKPGNVNGYALWVKDQIRTAKEKGNKITLTECAKQWPQVKEATREKYNEYARELRDEKEKQRDLYEITFGIKPRRPWKKISNEDREKYERVSKRDRLIYMVKKLEFNNYIFKKH